MFICLVAGHDDRDCIDDDNFPAANLFKQQSQGGYFNE